MTILSGFGRTSYGEQLPTDEGVFMGSKRGYINPQVAQISTLTVALAETGAFTATFTGPTGDVLTASYTATVGPDDNDAVAAALAADINGQAAWANVATAEAVAAVVTITFLHAGLAYTAVTAAPGSATLTHAVTQQAGGNILPIARWVVTRDVAVDGTPSMALPTNASVATDFVGLIVRTQAQLVNSGSVDPDATEHIPAATVWDVGYDGYMEVTNHGTVTAGEAATRAVFVVIDTAGGQEFGQSRSDADGGNTVALPVSQAYWATVTPPGERGRIQVRT